jgi:hypothetical protein
MQTEDDLSIPSFLKRTPEEQERIRQWNETHPVVAMSFMPEKTEEQRDADRAREEAEREKTRIRIAKMKNRLADKDRLPEVTKGKEWVNGQWVNPDLMTRARYFRILGELPTERHRKIFVANYSARVIGGVEPETKGKRK